MNNQQSLSAGQVASQLGARPYDVSNVVHQTPELRRLCPLFAGRRAIPQSAIPLVRAVLVQRGKLASDATASDAQGAVAEFNREVEAVMQRGNDRQSAVAAVARRNPQLHAEFLAATG